MSPSRIVETNLHPCFLFSHYVTNNVICMKACDESKESQSPTPAKWTFHFHKNFSRTTMTSQIESWLGWNKQSPQYENATKRTQNIMLETTRRIVKIRVFHHSKGNYIHISTFCFKCSINCKKSLCIQKISGPLSWTLIVAWK